MGAAVLASKACLRSGVGLLTTHIPAKGNNIIQTAVPETMTDIDENENYFQKFLIFQIIMQLPSVRELEWKSKLRML